MTRLPKRRNSRPRNQLSRRGLGGLRIENLEDRAMMATFTWTGTTNNDWFTASNWSNGGGADNGTAGIPDLGDSAIFNSAAPAATLSAPVTLNTLTFGTGTLNLGAALTVDTADFSANTGTVNAITNPLIVTNQLKLTPTVTAEITAGSTISVTGTNIVNDTVTGAGARTLTLSGGTLTFPPAQTGLSYFKVTGDADSGISNTNLYTHAIDPSGGGVSVNNIPFTNAPSGNISSLASQSYLLNGTTNTTIPNSISTSNFGDIASGTNTNGYAGVTGNMFDLLSHFDYNTPIPRTVTLTGLQPNTYYSVRTYEKQFDTSNGRTYTIAYDVGVDGTDLTAATIDQNHPENTPALQAIGVGQQNAWVDNFVYRTGPSQTSINLSINTNPGATYHFYGLSNQVLTATGVSFPNTKITATAAAQVDMRSRSSVSTFQNLSIPAATQVALSVAVADSYATLENTPKVVGDGSAPVIVYNSPVLTGGQNFGGSLGMDFNVGASPVTVTQLGVFDSGANGLSNSLNAYIYNRVTQTAVASITFAAGNTGTLIGGSRFLPLASPVVLPAGFQGSIVAEGYSAAEPLYNSNANPPFSTLNNVNGALTFVGSSRFGTAGAYPGGTDGGPANRYMAGTFMVGGGDPNSLLYNDINVTGAVPGTFPTALGGTVTISAGGGFTYNAANLTVDPAGGHVVTDSFTYTATTATGNITGTATVVVTGENDAPTITTPPSALIKPEGVVGVTFTVAAADRDQGDSLHYTWFVNNQQVGLDSPTLSLTWNALIAVGVNNGSVAGTSYPVRVDITDQHIASPISASTTLTITNVAPEVDISALPSEVLIGSTVDFAITASDPSPVDEADLTYLIDWNHDGDFNDAGEAVPGNADGPTNPISKVFNSAGIFHYRFAVRDPDGQVGEIQDYTLVVSQVIQDGDDIQIGGSNTVADKIIITMGNGGVLNVKVNNVTYNAFQDINEFTTITVRSGGGDDNITAVKMPIPITVFGGAGNDYIAGTSFGDTLFGEAGNDRILGGVGDDFLDGGDGADSLEAGAGNDTMYGGAGNDRMYGVAGDDIMYGDLSPDDLSEASPGNDTMDGGAGNDVMHGGDGNDSMTGNSGNDVVVGDAGNDRVLGAAGRDLLIGGDDADSLDGGTDDDILISSATVNDADDSILLAAIDEWANSGDSYEDRIASLAGGDFSPDGNVFQDDGAKDLLTGQSGRDWYMASLSDNDQIRGRVGSGAGAEQLDT